MSGRKEKMSVDDMPPLQQGADRKKAAYLLYSLGYMEGRADTKAKVQRVWDCLKAISYCEELKKREIIEMARDVISDWYDK